MNLSQQALLVNQAAISVVSNNISNVNTDGYSRQRVNLTPGVNYTPTGGSTLNQAYSTSGVEIASIERYADAYLQSYYRQQNSTESYLNEYAQVAANVEGLTNELKGAGLESAFTKFYESAQTLSLNPQDAIARQNYMQQAQTVALQFNDLAGNITDIRSSLVGDVSVPGSLAASEIFGMVSDTNSLLKQITDVNNSIVMVSCSDTPPSSLLDKRDQLIDELSALIPVTVSENTNGTINLSMNGIDIVKGTKQLASLNLAEGPDDNTPAIIQLMDENGIVTSIPINDKINSGQIGAVLDVCGVDPNKLTLKGVLDQYNTLASGFADIINGIQTLSTATQRAMAIDTTTNQLMPATENIFEKSDGTPITVADPVTASNIRINNDVMTDPFLIAVAKVNLNAVPPFYDPNAIGNNTNMLDVLHSRSANSGLLGNSSPEGALATIVGKIGLDTASLNNNLKNQSAVLTQVENQLSSVTGVNLDEELIDLTKYQTAYKASSRIYTVCNELLDILINLGR